MSNLFSVSSRFRNLEIKHFIASIRVKRASGLALFLPELLSSLSGKSSKNEGTISCNINNSIIKTKKTALSLISAGQKIRPDYIIKTKKTALLLISAGLKIRPD